MTLSTPQTAYASAKLQGTGVGRGLALGPVLRMPDPLPEPEDTPRTRSVAQEEERAVSSLSATGCWGSTGIPPLRGSAAWDAETRGLALPTA